MDERIAKKIRELEGLIGNTPLVEIHFEYKGELRKIFAKAENYNLTGSIKDRMAIHILKESYASGKIKAQDKIIEATSGNTGISFSALGAALGHEVTIYMPEWMSPERKNLIKSYGARIELVSKRQGGFIASIKKAEDCINRDSDVFLPCQFSNDFNIDAHYQTTGPEILRQFTKLSLGLDAVVAGVGTGGTIMGLAKYFKQKNKAIKAFPLEPANSPIMQTEGKIVGKHRIEGIADEFISALIELAKLDQIIAVDDGDAIIMAQKLASHLGLGVGISSGANFLGAVLAQDLLGREKNVVTIFADDNKKYLSTDLLKKERLKESFISPQLELVDLKVHPA